MPALGTVTDVETARLFLSTCPSLAPVSTKSTADADYSALGSPLHEEDRLDKVPTPRSVPRNTPHPPSRTHSPTNPHLTRIRPARQRIPRRDAQIQMSLVAADAGVRDRDLDDVARAADALVRRGPRVGDADAAAAEGVGAEGGADGRDERAVWVLLAAGAEGAALVVEGCDARVAGWRGG